MQSENLQIVKISGNDWYVETRTGLDGPFESVKEATTFLELMKCSNAARIEFAGLQYTPID